MENFGNLEPNQLTFNLQALNLFFSGFNETRERIAYPKNASCNRINPSPADWDL